MPQQVLLKFQCRRFPIIVYSHILIIDPGIWRTVMGGFIEQLMLAEKAAENIYFARLNRELIEALHKRAGRREQSPATSRSSAEARTDNNPVIIKEPSGG
jgi:hypothetical protein